MSQTEFFLGIDLGSSSVKTTLFSPNEGRVVDSYSFPENEMEIISIKKGWAEQEPNYWWECVKKSLFYKKCFIKLFYKKKALSKKLFIKSFL